MNIAVVYNPVGADESVEAVRRGLGNQSQVTWVETTEDDPGLGQTRRCIAEGTELVIAVGGDGTVRACAEGVSGERAVLGIVPAGTGNLLARNLEIPMDPAEALEVALEGHTRRLDAGTVNGETFTVIAGAGIDAVVMDETSREAKDRLGVLAYVVEGAKHVFDEPLAAAISVDDGEPIAGSWATVMVGNLGRLQGGVDLFPDSTPSDGKLDLLGLSARSPLQNLAAAFSLIGDGDRLVRAQGKAFVVEFERPTPYQLDGEARPETAHLEFRVDPAALRIRTPRSPQ